MARSSLKNYFGVLSFLLSVFVSFPTSAAVRLDNVFVYGTSIPTVDINSKALLQLESTTQGFLPPRLTGTQRDAITSVPEALAIYNSSTHYLNFWNGSAWKQPVTSGDIVNADIATGAAIAYSKLNLTGQLMDADINSSAAISRGKIATGTPLSVVINGTFGELGSTTVLGTGLGGTNNGSLAVTAGGVLYTDGSKLVNVGAGTTGQALKSNGASPPTWGAVAGGSGLKNYLSVYIASTSSGVPNTGNGDFELGATTGFALGTTGTLTNGLPTGTPTFGSGASSNLSINITNGGLQIAGTASLTYSQAVSATVAGNMLASNAFFIDKADQGGILTYSLKYFAATSPGSANWSGTSSSSFGVAVWDVTNSVWLGVSNPFGFVQSSGSGLLNGAFPVPTNTTQLRFVVYNANATSGTITVFFDDATVGPATPASVNGKVVASRAHISTGASTTSSNALNFDTVDYDYTGSITTGTGTSWGYKAPYSGLYVLHAADYFGATTAGDNVFLNGSDANIGLLTAIGNTSAGNGSVHMLLKAGDVIQLRPSGTITPQGGATTAAVNFIEIFMIGGVSGSAIPNPNVGANNWMSSNTSVTANTTRLNFDSKDHDFGNNVVTGTNWAFTAPVSGMYQINLFLLETVNSNYTIYVYKNGSQFKSVSSRISSGPLTGSTEVYLNATDSIYFISDTNQTFTGGTQSSADVGAVTITLTQPTSGTSVPTSNVFSSSFGFISAEFVSFGGTTEPSICSSSPCTMYRHTPAITSVTRTANGQYSINFAAGTFSQPPVCTSQHTGFASSGWTQRVTGTVPTTTVYQVQTIVSSATNDGGPVDVICMGPR